MQYWKNEDGVEFKNSADCFGREYQPSNLDKIDVAKISIRSRFPEKGWGYLDECHEMAVVVRGNGYVGFKDGDKQSMAEGDVVYIELGNRFCWGGDMDMIVTCGPAFSPDKHHLEEEV